MIASLMMYARPELETAHNRLWASIRDRLREVGILAPRTLSQDADEFHVWNHPDLILSQTCGMPFRLWLHPQVYLTGTLDYGLEGCESGYYQSIIVVHVDDPREDLAQFADARFAYNQSFSQSGYAAPFWHAKAQGVTFTNCMQTGGHLASARAVSNGQADIAAIDAVTWRNLVKFDSFASKLRVLDKTAPSPGLPLITGAKNDPQMVIQAVQKAIGDLGQGDKSDLGLQGIENIAKEDYLAVKNPPKPAS